jgi:hypothetical protein
MNRKSRRRQIKFYKTMVMPTSTCSSAIWTITKKRKREKQTIETAER